MSVIIAHTIMALSAFLLGSVILLLKKGTNTHRLLGRLFVVIMAMVATSSLFIQQLNEGSFSWIHIFVPITAILLFMGIYNIKQFTKTRNPKYLRKHRYIMVGLFIGALGIAGLFTLLPGRYLHILLFGA